MSKSTAPDDVPAKTAGDRSEHTLGACLRYRHFHHRRVSGGGHTLGDGGPAASALLHFPFAVAMSSTGSCWWSTAATTSCGRSPLEPTHVIQGRRQRKRQRP